MRIPTVALLTDFGTRDWYAASIKAVIISRAPEVRLVDITHEVPRHDILSGAMILSTIAPMFPRGTIFVAVVDPGVGGKRALLAARADGRYFIGPDNGLLALSLRRDRGATIIRLSNRKYWLPEVSATFHARDIMAPIAAYLARRGSLKCLGAVTRRFTPLAIPTITRRHRSCIGRVIHIDHFGNLITNLDQGVLPRRRGAIVRYKHKRIPVVSSYTAVRLGCAAAVVGSCGFLEVAVRNGSAASRLHGARGDLIILECPE